MTHTVHEEAHSNDLLCVNQYPRDVTMTTKNSSVRATHSETYMSRIIIFVQSTLGSLGAGGNHDVHITLTKYHGINSFQAKI